MIRFIKENRILSLVVLMGFLLRLIGIMPNIIHPDEPFIQLKSWELLYNIFSKGDFNPHTFKYGPITFYLNALSSFPVFIYSFFMQTMEFLKAGQSLNQISFYTLYDNTVYKYGNELLFLGRLRSVIIGTLSIYLVYFSAKYIFNKKTALISSLFFAIAPIHIRDSHFLTNDILALFFDLLSFYLIIKIIKQKKLKNIIFAGFISGYASTVRYFPISILLFTVGIFYLLITAKRKIRILILSIVSVLLGIALGMPFLYFDKYGFSGFISDLEKYALPWYGTGFTSFFFAFISYIFSLGKTEFPSLGVLLPSQRHLFYVNYLLFTGFGFLLSVLSVAGLLKLVLKDFKNFIIIGIIPVFTFIYFVFYIPTHAMPYEKNIIPMIPFLCISAGYLLHKMKGFKLNLILFFIILQPLIISALASYSCSMVMIQKEAANWIKNNIADGNKVANFPLIFFPSGINFAQLDSFDRPSKIFGLSEIGRGNYDYVFINAGRLDYETYRFFSDYFIPKSIWYENSYYYLALKEYLSEGKLLKTIKRCRVCDATRIYFIKLNNENKKNYLKGRELFSFDFNSPDDVNKWNIFTFASEVGSLKRLELDGIDDKFSLEYKINDVDLLSPRLMSGKIRIKPDTYYEVSFWVKNNFDNKNQRIFGRIDYYLDTDKKK